VGFQSVVLFAATIAVALAIAAPAIAAFAFTSITSAIAIATLAFISFTASTLTLTISHWRTTFFTTLGSVLAVGLRSVDHYLKLLARKFAVSIFVKLENPFDKVWSDGKTGVSACFTWAAWLSRGSRSTFAWATLLVASLLTSASLFVSIAPFSLLARANSSTKLFGSYLTVIIGIEFTKGIGGSANFAGRQDAITVGVKQLEKRICGTLAGLVGLSPTLSCQRHQKCDCENGNQMVLHGSVRDVVKW
jgi:hypothetical protein